MCVSIKPLRSCIYQMVKMKTGVPEWLHRQTFQRDSGGGHHLSVASPLQYAPINLVSAALQRDSPTNRPSDGE